jgi:hypothetical protein
MSLGTDLLATVVLDERQADLIRLRFYNNNKNGEFCELARCFPKFVDALILLPDTSGFRYCNVMLRDMVIDTIKLFGFEQRKEML